MVEATLKEKALPVRHGGQRLLMFPFPRTEPEVDIRGLQGETMIVRCMDAQCYFAPSCLSTLQASAMPPSPQPWQRSTWSRMGRRKRSPLSTGLRD